MFSRLFFRHFFDSWNDGLQGLLQRSDDDVTFILTLHSKMHRHSFVAVGKNHDFFCIHHISLANWLRLAKAFLNSVRKEGIAEHSPQFLLREQITAIYALVELHEGSSMVMPLTLSSLMAEMTELDL